MSSYANAQRREALARIIRSNDTIRVVANSLRASYVDRPRTAEDYDALVDALGRAIGGYKVAQSILIDERDRLKEDAE